MAYLKVHCWSCGGSWFVYPKQREYDASRICPHCDSRIDGETWQTHIVPALVAVREANAALMSDHVNYHTGQFEVDVIADTVFEIAKRGNGCDSADI